MLRSCLVVWTGRNLAHTKRDAPHPLPDNNISELLEAFKLDNALMELLVCFCLMSSDNHDNFTDLLLPLAAIWTLPGHNLD